MTVSLKLDIGQSVKSFLKIMAAFLVVCLPVVCGCSHTEQVLIGPQMDLAPYRIIGVIEFSSNGEAELSQYVTQNYLQRVQNAQPEVRFLELGSQDRVLSKVSHQQLDYEAIKSIGRIYNVDAIMFGNLNLSEAKPKVSVSSTWQSMIKPAN